MNKIIFADNTEMQIADVTNSGDTLTVTVDTSDANSVINKFQSKAATSVMRYYAGTDLIRGYSGFTKMQDVRFEPDFVKNVDYTQTDQTTESGFVEYTTDRCIVTMKKVSMLVSVAGQAAQNTANIDYLAMEAGVEL